MKITKSYLKQLIKEELEKSSTSEENPYKQFEPRKNIENALEAINDAESETSVAVLTETLKVIKEYLEGALARL